jgi:hypothetical protein
MKHMDETLGSIISLPSRKFFLNLWGFKQEQNYVNSGTRDIA